MPLEALDVFNKLRRNSDAPLSEITDSVFAGTQTSANKIYVVTPLDADRIEPSDTGDTVRIVPSGKNREHEIETDLLCPWLKGRDIQRWQGEWSGQHVILPYYVEYRNDEANVCVYSQDYLREDLPLTWEYLTEHREQLENREGGKMRGRDDWYAFIYPKSHE